MSKRSLLSILTVIFLIVSLSVQAQQFGWAGNMGSLNNDYGRAVVSDDTGNVYNTGFFEGTADFDPGAGTANLTSAGLRDGYLAKYSPSGNLVWAKSFGGTGYEYSYTVDMDDAGNIYVAGRFEGTVDFNPGAGTFNLTSAGGPDMFVLKFDNSGNFVWAAGMGGTATEQINSIHVDGQGNVYATGVFNGSADFDPGSGSHVLTSAGGEEIFILKLNASGNLEWANQFGGTLHDRAYSITLDNSGNIYATGIFNGTADFDPGTGTAMLTSAGLYDGFIMKVDNNGQYIWARSISGSSYVFGYGIISDDFGNVYTTGYFRNTVDFDPGAGIDTLTSEGDYDIFIQKMDSAGNYKWSQSMGGSSDDRGYQIAVDGQGDIYVTGYFIGTVDFDPSSTSYNVTSAGNADFYVYKTDSAGNFLWVMPMGGVNHDFGIGLEANHAGVIFLTGSFEGTADFDPDLNNSFLLTPTGGSDAFLMKLMQCNSYNQLNITACDSYTSPSGNYTWKTSGSYKDTLLNAAGCDSIITIDLAINQSSAVSLSVNACGSYASPSGNHTWTTSGTYHDTLLNAAGCDSVITIALVVNSSESTQGNITICHGDSIFLAGEFQSSAGIYVDTFHTVDGCDSIVTTDLEIVIVDVTVSSATNTLTANATGAHYQWLDCDNNFSIVPGETSQNFTSTVSGNYAVLVTDGNGCTDTSDCYFVSAVGIDDPVGKINFTVFPNPAVNLATIDLGEKQLWARANLFANDGKLVISQAGEFTKTIQLDMASLTSGVYLLRIETNAGVEIKKLVKE